jgi:hypothetical protein
MTPFFIWLESSTFSVWVRESPSVFAFPIILAVHTIGMGLVAGINAVVALRVLGFATKVPLAELSRFLPVMWFGFWINAASGLALLIGYPTKALTNPLFYLKLASIAAAVALIAMIRKAASVERARRLARASLACWVFAITSGRLLAYTYHKLMSL